MKFLLRYAWLWMAMIMWSLVLACVNLVHVFSFPFRMWVLGCLVWGTCAILAAFAHQRART